MPGAGFSTIRVAVMMPNVLQYPIAIAAILRAGENLDMKALVGVAARIATSGNVLCIGSGQS